jgi:HTH-type transcriptional regulator/antitoxin HipB
MMYYPINTSVQLRAVLQALRQSRNLSQEEVGHLLGVNQKRVARIESAPGVTSFDQIARLVTALGARLVIETPDTKQPTTDEKAKKGRRRKAMTQGNW